MMPWRSLSYRGMERCIISMAQQARPKERGQREPWRAQLARASMLVLGVSRCVRSVCWEVGSVGWLDALTGHIQRRNWACCRWRVLFRFVNEEDEGKRVGEGVICEEPKLVVRCWNS